MNEPTQAHLGRRSSLRRGGSLSALCAAGLTTLLLASTPGTVATASPQSAADADVQQSRQVAAAATADAGTLVFVRQGARVSAAGTAAAADIITCKGTYDRPHPGHSKNNPALAKKRINAHLTVRCTRPVPYANPRMQRISVKSRMVAGKRVGAWSSKSKAGKSSLSVGGDLACKRRKATYRAQGSWTATPPPGYTPPVHSASVRSAKVKFKLSTGGVCRKVS